MGSGSSQDTNTVSFDSFFNSEEKPYFIIYPEEQILNQKFVISKGDENFYKKKENYLVTARTIIEIFLNFSILTQEKSQFEVLKKIIIPLFSQYLLTDDQKIINSVLLFKYCKSMSALFIEKHNRFLSDFFTANNSKIILPQLDTNEICIQNTQIFSKFVNSLFSSNSKKKFYFNFQKSALKNTNILTFLDIEPTNTKLLVNSFIWSLHTCDLFLLLNTFQKLFSLEKVQNNESKNQSKKNTVFENLPKMSPHQNFSHFNIKLSHQNFNGYINCTDFQFSLPNYKSKHCIIGATPFYLFVYNHSKEKNQRTLIKIKITHNNVPDNSKRFSYFPSYNFFSGEYGIVIADNVVVFLDQNHNILFRNSDPDYMKDKVTVIPRRSPQPELPFTSDGHYIYSFLSVKEIGVYTVDIEKGVLIFVRKISIKEDKNKLERPFKDKVIPNKLLDNALLVTNGIILELIYPEQLEKNQYSHFVRVISLSKGKHICDFRFNLNYKLESVCFEPFSRSVWGLAVHSEGFCLINYCYDGPDPLWISNDKINEDEIHIKNITSISRFNRFAVDYIYSLFIQFYGSACKSNDLMLSYFVRSANFEMFDLLISLFSIRTNDFKFNQFLFLILSFQLKFIKLETKQLDSLYDILKQFINNENYFCFLVIFIINLIDYLDTQNTSKYFNLIFKSSLYQKKRLFAIYCILSRCYHSKNFPYVFENEKIELVQKLYNNLISNDEFELLINYQSSLFRNYSEIFQSNSQYIKKIEDEVLNYSSSMFQNVTLLIPLINSIEMFNQSLFISVFRKLLVLLKLTTISSSFPREILKLLLPLMKTCTQQEKLSLNDLNPFFYFFFDIFFLYSQFFKQILTFTDIELFKKYEQFLDIKIEKEKNVSDVFNSKLTEEEFKEIIDVLYTKVSNPMNKRLSNEDKVIENLIFLSIIYQSGLVDEFIDIKEKISSKTEIKISQDLRQIVQSVYRIRSNFRSKKQKEDQTDYFQTYKNIEEKCHFLLQYSAEKNQIKDISNFINNNVQISEVVLAQNRLKDVKINLSVFIQMIDYIFMKNFPKSCLYSFLMYLSENSDILNSFELLIKYVKIDSKKALAFIQNLLKYFVEMPPNAIISFISIILIMVSKAPDEPQLTQRIINDSLSVLIGRMILRSKELHKTIFKSSITFLCYFYRIICDENMLIKDANEITVIESLLSEASVKNSMSFTLAHAMIHGYFKPKIIPNVINIIGLVGEPKFHSFTLLLYEHLLIKANTNKAEFISDLTQIMIIIGSVFCGSTTNKILQIATPINKLSNSTENAFVRTPTSQQACALELVQLIRRLILEKKSEAPTLINDYFKSLSKSVQMNDTQYLKQLYAMLVIMSNVISIKRPNTIITTNENKSYFVLSMNEKANEITGVLLPISNQQLVIHKLFISQNIRTSEMIQYNLSLFNTIDIPYSIFELASSTQMKIYSDCLFTFFALECVKENILDSEHGSEFSNNFYSMKIPAINKFIFKTSVPLILSLLKKSLIIPTNGIFVGSPVRPILFHTSVNQLVFEDDYTLTPNLMEANFCPHIFISSILDDANASYFSIKIDNSTNLCHIFGVVTHSVDQNHLISITYSSREKAFCINGKKARSFEPKNNCTFECRYLPSKNKVAFATSDNRRRVFSCILPEKSRCSFIALMKRNSRNNYLCTMKATTDCFQKNIHFGQNPIKMLKRFGNKLFQTEIDETVTKFSMLTLDDKEEDSLDIVNYSKEILEQGKTTKEIISSPNIGNNSINSFASFKDLRETNILLTEYPNYSILPKNHSIYSSPQKLPNYFQVYDVSGQFDLVPSSNVILNQSNFVPPFHFENFYYLPTEVINCYFSGVCELHRSEVLTLYFSRIITNSNDVFKSLNNFSINTSMIIYFITNVLLLLEPIKMANLSENKSPIDFESFNGLKTCAKIEMFDYFTCLTKIIHSFEKQKIYEFISEWFKKLNKDFHNKYMHFATSRNTRLIQMNSSIINKNQIFNQSDATGWIIFPIQFGFKKMPVIEVNNLIYPSSFSNYSTYAYSRGNQLDIKIENNGSYCNTTFGLLPFCQDSNESLFNSFYQLAVSFKYFVLFSHNDLNENQKLNLISFLFDSIVAGSPFFYSHCDEIFAFLKNKINLPFTNDYVSKLNVFIASVYKLNNESINHFLNEQISLFDDVKSSVFKYFISDSERVPIKITLPNPIIPHTITSTTFNPSVFLVSMSRILLNKTRNEDFPYHLVLSEWAYSFSLFPECELTFIESNILQINFTKFIPSSFRLIDQDYNGNEIVYVSLTGDFNQNYAQTTVKNIEIKCDNRATFLKSDSKKIFVMFPNQETVSQRNLIVVSNNLADTDSVPLLAYQCRSCFINDMKEFTNNFTVDDDQHILMKVDINRFTENKISTRLWPGIISTLDTRVHKPRMLFLRAIYLIAFNFVCLKHPSLMSKQSFSQFRPFVSVLFSMNRFLQLLDEYSGDTYVKLYIDRQLGLDVRNGLSKNVNKSMIGQFTHYYMRNKRDFTNKTKPFYVVFLHENGIDAGGLRRELASELVKDINSERVGLFTKTPNSRNHEGKYQECMIPSPDPAISNSWCYYQAIGALISIGIRSRLQQPDLIFPPLFWNFLVTGNLTIDDIYSIDKSYKNLTQNILNDRTKMTDEEFERNYSSSSFLNSRGSQIKIGSLSGLFSSRKVKKDNCMRIIAECNEIRLNELRIPLENIRIGFWENVTFPQPLFVTSNLIELLACGDRIISAEKLKNSLSFSFVPYQQRKFLNEVINRMTNEQRRKLIQFSTGLSTLSDNKIIVDFLNYPADSRLPTSSTCFFKLHLPPFSSAEKMFNAFDIAINETGTFENS